MTADAELLRRFTVKAWPAVNTVLTAEVLDEADTGDGHPWRCRRSDTPWDGPRGTTIDLAMFLAVNRYTATVCVEAAFLGLSELPLFAVDLAVDRAATYHMAAVEVRPFNHPWTAGWHAGRVTLAVVIPTARPRRPQSALAKNARPQHHQPRRATLDTWDRLLNSPVSLAVPAAANQWSGHTVGR